jgi:hypothetical protein
MAQKKSFVLRINPETLRELVMQALKENGREPKPKKEASEGQSGEDSK